MSYDTQTDIYTEDGRIKQIEYAMKAMTLGTTTIAAIVNNSIVMVSEKKLANILQKPNSVKKHFKIYDNVITAFAGITADALNIIKKCRTFCLEHEAFYGTLIPSKLLLDRICNLALKFGEKDDFNKIYSRPFGISLVLGVYEKNTPRLFCMDPSGSYTEYRAKAIGAASEIIEQQLEVMDLEQLTLKKLVDILKHSMADKMTETNVEISILTKNGIKKYSSEDISLLIK